VIITDRSEKIICAIWACLFVAIIVGFALITGPVQTEEQVWVPQGAQIVNQVDSVKYLQSQRVEFGSTVVMEVPYKEFRDKVGRGDVVTSIDSYNNVVVYYYVRIDDILYVSRNNHPGTWFRQVQAVELASDQLIVREEGISGAGLLVIFLGGFVGGGIAAIIIYCFGGAAYSWLEMSLAKKQAAT